MFSHGLLQVVTKPTRCTLTSATLIDQIFTNSHDDNFETIVVIGKLSDHFPILHFLSSRKPTLGQKHYRQGTPLMRRLIVLMTR